MEELTAAEIAGRIRRRELSPVEVVDAALARIEAGNERLNAFVFLDPEQARERAREAERAVSSGEPLGPLHGVPTAMKDLFDFKPGWPTTFGGVRALKDFVADFHCAWAERMERAGAIIVGKTNSPVMGFRGTCDNPLFGPTRNPFDTTRNAGGSSGGSAAAVAAGLVPVAEATDGGGSTRIPASWCGRPARGDATDRAAVRGRRRAGGERRLRAAAAVARELWVALVRCHDVSMCGSSVHHAPERLGSDGRCLVVFEGRGTPELAGQPVSLAEDLPELRQVAMEYGLLL